MFVESWVGWVYIHWLITSNVLKPYWNHIETLLQTNVCRFYIQFGVNLEGLKYPKLDEVSISSFYQLWADGIEKRVWSVAVTFGSITLRIISQMPLGVWNDDHLCGYMIPQQVWHANINQSPTNGPSNGDIYLRFLPPGGSRWLGWRPKVVSQIGRAVLVGILCDSFR